jgi:6-phosphofructokinase
MLRKIVSLFNSQVDFKKQAAHQIELLPHSPASAIGTFRTKLQPDDYVKLITILRQNCVKYLLFNGGNGSMDTCGKIYKLAAAEGIQVIGIPKTIDNDIAETDHCPGFGSAARYLAVSVAEAAQDIKAMPIHVCVIEAMGRNAGWIAASSSLARQKSGDAPHLIYLPERPFKVNEFLEDVDRLHRQLGGVCAFFKQTKVDCLAISYGTKHGAVKGEGVKLRKEIAIAAMENLQHEGITGFLVSHGSSTVPQYI